jgi:hypothetical protein
MDDQESNANGSKNSEREFPPNQIGGENHGGDGDQNSSVSGDEENGSDQPPNRWGDLGFDRKIELVLAGIIVLSSISQIIVILINNTNTGKQVDKIIAAESGINNAATQIQQAGYTFSGAAIGINNAGWDAVGKLQEQASQVERSAAAAENSIKATQEQMRLDQRAWVGTGQFTGIPEVGKPYAVSVTFQNPGKSPAIDVVTQARAMAVGPGQKFIPAFDQKQGPVESRSVLFPNQVTITTTKTYYPRPLTQADVDTANDPSKISIYVIARTCYKDVFRRKHWARSCAAYNPDGKNFISCDQYNEIDSEATENKETCTFPTPPSYPN